MSHHLSRERYGKLNHLLCNEEWERLKELARQDRRMEEEIESIPRPNLMSRHKLWKLAWRWFRALYFTLLHLVGLSVCFACFSYVLCPENL